MALRSPFHRAKPDKREGKIGVPWSQRLALKGLRLEKDFLRGRPVAEMSRHRADIGQQSRRPNAIARIFFLSLIVSGAEQGPGAAEISESELDAT